VDLLRGTQAPLRRRPDSDHPLGLVTSHCSTGRTSRQGAVRSLMDIRVCFRVRERKDVDLVLGQRMLAAGWHAHALNAPGKFLVSTPDTTPRAARAATSLPTRPSPKPPQATQTAARDSMRNRCGRSAPQPAREGRPGDPGRLGALAGWHRRGAGTVSDCLAACLVMAVARLHICAGTGPVRQRRDNHTV
jgi:hypothetical protein